MTPPATQDDTERRLGELSGRERDAWERYREELRPLDGPAYGHAEPAAWEALQEALDAVREERAAIIDAPPG